VTATVLRFAATCPPCEEGRHDRCWQYFGELFGYEHVPCKCFPQCRDEHGDLTHAALVEMARRHPEELARRIRFDAAMERSSLHLHLRATAHKISAP
jgi:hypothetical protein